MAKYIKSPIDELFYSLMGFYPTKEGAAYEIISAAALSLLEHREAKHNQFLIGLSASQYQLDGLIENDTMIESKDYTKRGAKVGRDDLQKMEGALTDLLEIKKGYFTSATEYTEPAQMYAEATSKNPLQKEIIPVYLRPSTKDDEKGRVNKIQIQLTMVVPDFKNGKFNILYFDKEEELKLQKFIETIGPMSLKIEEFYDSSGNVIETVENICKKQQPKFAMQATEVDGVFNIEAYIKVNGNMFSIKGLKYHIPILHHTETFTIESEGDAKLLIKCDKLNINKLMTDIEMINAIKGVMESK